MNKSKKVTLKTQRNLKNVIEEEREPSLDEMCAETENLQSLET